MSESNSTLFQMYCINLKERPDRWQRFAAQPGLQRVVQHYPFERFEGVNGKLLDIKNEDRVSLRTKRNILYQKRRDHEDLDTAGGVGCYLSHYGCWQKFLQGRAEYCLIFEDDAEVPLNFVEQLEAAMNDIEQEDVKRPEIWLLSRPWGPTMRKVLELNEIQYTNNWAYDVTGPLTGYILSRNAAKILCDNALPIDGHVDHYMHRCAQMGLLTISHNKNIILRQVGVKTKDSDIQQKPNCEICDLPNAPQKKGYLILSNQTVGALTVGLLGIGALLAIRTFGKK
jgi:GR25 family glycosyltransferase involved in LPS biosynthesis